MTCGTGPDRNDDELRVSHHADSDALDVRSLAPAVGGFRIGVLEDPHVLLEGTRAMLDASRFAQVGSWSGTLSVDGPAFAADPEV